MGEKMFASMTAFGRCRDTVGGKDITVEIRSVNSRYFDCSARLPRAYAYLEEKIKPYLVSRGILRGKVDVNIGVEVVDSGEVSVALDEGYARGYIAALGRLRDEFRLRDDISVMTVAQNRDVFKLGRPEDDAARDWGEILAVLERAADGLLEARRAEGERLESDIRTKLGALRAYTEEISALSKADAGGCRQRLEERLRPLLAEAGAVFDEGRIIAECAIFADRISVDEELVRLSSHLASFAAIAASDEAAGRKLDFLIQEMNREINTIGSKCQNAAISRIVVDCKCELEKIREQIQNIE